MTPPCNHQESPIIKSNDSNSASLLPVTRWSVLLNRNLGNTLASTATTAATDSLSAIGWAFFIIGTVEHVKLPRAPYQWYAKKKHCLKGFETRVVHLPRVEDSSVKLAVCKNTVRR